MITFRMKPCVVRPGEQVVEILDGDQLLGTIHPQVWGISIVSNFLDGRRLEQVAVCPTIPPALEVRLP